MRNESETKEPVVFHLLGAACAVAVLVMQFFVERGGNSAWRGVGIACLLIAPIFMFPPFLLLRRYGHPGQDEPYHRATTVVHNGLYAIVRHPQYVGYVLLTAGFAALAQHLLTTVLAIGAAVAFHAHTIREEAFCRARWGPAYGHYMRRVPRFNFLLGLARHVRRQR